MTKTEIAVVVFIIIVLGLLINAPIQYVREIERNNNSYKYRINSDWTNNYETDGVFIKYTDIKGRIHRVPANQVKIIENPQK